MTEEIVGGDAPTLEQIEAARKLIERAGLRVLPEEQPPKGRCAAFRAWEKAKWAALTTLWSTLGVASFAAKAIKGVRTLLFFTVTGAGALIASIEGIDLSGYMSRLTGWELQSADVVLIMSAAGFGLRLITDSSAFQRWKKAARGDGVAPGVGSGDVDEPEGAV